MTGPKCSFSTRVRTGAIAAFCLAGLAGAPAPANADAFERWVSDLWPSARAKGVSRTVYTSAFAGVSPDPDVLESANYQPEFVKPVGEYLARATSDKRIANGRQKLAEMGNLLNAIEAIYGVNRHIVVAIWGMESGYGEFLGEKGVIRSLATLGYTGSRRRFGRTQLLAALQILQRGDTTPNRMTGSWAGAMGHTQFIPTTYQGYAVDFDGDGRRDIWETVADALASTANYLRASGWRTGEPWGYEVAVPRNFSFAHVESGSKTVRDWQNLGLRAPGGGALAHPDLDATLILPAGARGPAFLIFRNFRSILRYNNATAYALAVGHLSDRLRGEGPLAASWPEDRELGAQGRRELQRLLNARGYSVGTIDGIIGGRTRDAIRAFQKSAGLAPDGYASESLLARLRSN